MADLIPASIPDQSAWQLVHLSKVIKSHLHQILTTLHLSLADLKDHNWYAASHALTTHVHKVPDAPAINWDGLRPYWALPSPVPALTSAQFGELQATFRRLKADGSYFGTIFRLVEPGLEPGWLQDQGWALILEILLIILPTIVPEAQASSQIEPWDYVIRTMVTFPSIEDVLGRPPLQSNFTTLVNFWHGLKQSPAPIL
jgi:hypothetical protein